MNQPSKCKTRNWVKTNYESRGNYNTSSIKFRASMIRSNLCDYSDVYILVSGTVKITGEGDSGAEKRADKRNEGVIFKDCAPFTECISNVNNTQVDLAKYINVVMPVYNLIENSDSYSKTSGSLWQYYKDVLNDNITEFESLKSKIKITGKTSDDGNTKNVEIVVPLKYLNDFGRTLEMPLIIVKLFSI